MAKHCIAKQCIPPSSGKVPISALWHSVKPNTEGQAIAVQETTINNRTEHFSAMQNSIRHLSEPKRLLQSKTLLIRTEQNKAAHDNKSHCNTAYFKAKQNNAKHITAKQNNARYYSLYIPGAYTGV